MKVKSHRRARGCSAGRVSALGRWLFLARVPAGCHPAAPRRRPGGHASGMPAHNRRLQEVLLRLLGTQRPAHLLTQGGGIADEAAGLPAHVTRTAHISSGPTCSRHMELSTTLECTKWP